MGTTVAQVEPASDNAAARKDLEPRLVNIVGDEIPLEQALADLQKQTGNTVVDRRRQRGNPKLRLLLSKANFWQSLDEICRMAGCGYSYYEEDGQLALVDTPRRQLARTYPGIFRVEMKRISVTRDDATGVSFCDVLVEVAWEPRFQPFYLDVGPVQAVQGGPRNGLTLKAPGHGQIKVAERGAVEVDLRLPAPPRSCPILASLTGQFTFTGPHKMLAFQFAAGKPIQQKQDGVEVTLTPRTIRAGKWMFDVGIVNPPGGPRFDSNQWRDWLGNNQILLENKEGAKPFVVRPENKEGEEIGKVDGTQAKLRYVFTGDLPASPAGWTVIYRTPGRIVELPVTFSFRDIALP